MMSFDEEYNNALDVAIEEVVNKNKPIESVAMEGAKSIHSHIDSSLGISTSIPKKLFSEDLIEILAKSANNQNEVDIQRDFGSRILMLAGNSSGRKNDSEPISKRRIPRPIKPVYSWRL